MKNVVLSLFPGIGLLDRAFEEEGYCIVRGPDVLWGGDVRKFSPPPHIAEGVIGGPPCQMFSRMRHLNPLAGAKQGNLIPEFERVVLQARPEWFVMENVPEAPEPVVDGYIVRALLLNNRHVDTGNGMGAEQNRVRRFSFGTRDGRSLVVAVALFEAPIVELAVTASRGEAAPVRMERAPGGGHRLKRRLRAPTVMAGHGPVQAEPGTTRADVTRTLQQMCELQGLPPDFADDLPFTAHGKRKVIGNGVPMYLGRAIAAAVRRAMEGA